MRKWGIARFVAARICYKLKMRRRYARKWRKMEEKKYDLVIIGAGPAGLSAAVYGVRAGLELVVLEKIIICLIFVILLLCLIFTPSFWVGLALFFFFLWAIVF